jgi:hypothetical protein
VKHGWITVLASSLVLWAVAVSPAQVVAVGFEGRVLWIAGNTLVISLEASPSINVDLSEVAQDQYQGLEEGDWVLVTGTVTRERDRVIATSVQRVGA